MFRSEGFFSLERGATARLDATGGTRDESASAQARVAQSPDAGRRAVQRTQGALSQAGPEDGVRGGALPQHRRVLARGHRHHHDPRRDVHARLPLLRRQDGQPARRGRPARAREHRARARPDGPVVRGADHGRSRRPARRRRRSRGAHGASASASCARTCWSRRWSATSPATRADVRTVVEDGRPDVFAHNVEVVPRLQRTMRDARCSWERSVEVLAGRARRWRQRHQDVADGRLRRDRRRGAATRCSACARPTSTC